MTESKSRPEATATSKAGSQRWLRALEPLPCLAAWASENTVAVTAGLFGFLIAKVLVVARGDVATALGILRTAGLTTVVIGGLLSGLPLLVVGLLAVTGYRLAQSASVPAIALFAVAAALFFFLAPLLLAVLLLVWAVAQGIKSRRSPTSNRRLVRSFGLTAVSALALLLGVRVLYSVWLPRERLTIAGEQRVGYVLDEDSGDWFTLLESGSRRIRHSPRGQVSGRTVCRLKLETGSWWRRGDASAWQLLDAYDRLPEWLRPPPVEPCR